MKELEMFIKYLEEKRQSKHTIINYSKDISQFFDFIKKPPAKVNHNDISKFIDHNKNLATSTSNRKLSSLKSFFKFLVKYGVIEHNPTDIIECAKVEQKLPRVVDYEDIIKLLNTIDNKRDKAIIEILYGAGVRREELSQLKVEDINFNKGYIRVFGKGRKERLVPLNPSALNLSNITKNTPTSLGGR